MNAFDQGAPAPAQNTAPPMGGQPGNMMTGGPAPGPAPAAQPPMPTPQQIAQARAHAKVVLDDLIALVSEPVGSLKKSDVFDAAADMIAKGAFPTPESKQDLIVRLAQLPDDEPSLRKALGAVLGEMAGHHEAMQQAFGQSEGSA